MNSQGEFLSDAFHLLAQPIVALRARIELALIQPLKESECRQTLEGCLELVDRLMHEVALLRELANLEENAPQSGCDGLRILQETVAELAPVAEQEGIALELNSEPAMLLASEAALRRALFVLLDATLGGVGSGGRVTRALRPTADSYELEIRPGVPPGGRRELCRRLLQHAGGRGLHFKDGHSTAILRRSGAPAPDAGAGEANGNSGRSTPPCGAGGRDTEHGL